MARSAISGCARLAATSSSGSPTPMPSARSGSPAGRPVGRRGARPRGRRARRSAVVRIDAAPTPDARAAAGYSCSEPEVTLPPMPPGEEVVNDYASSNCRCAPIRPRSCAPTLPAAASSATRTCGPARRARRRLRPRHHSPAAGLGQRRHLHDHRGRNRDRQHHRLAEELRTLPAGHSGRAMSPCAASCSRSGVIHVVAWRIEDLTALLARLTEDAPDRGAGARRRGQAPARRGRRQPRPRPPQPAAHRGARRASRSAGQRPRRAGARLGTCALARGGTKIVRR